MRGLVIAVLLAVGLIPWLIAMPCLWLCMRIAVLGRRLAPGMLYGNCWTYALARHAEHGGYLLCRPAEKVRLLWVFKVPHVIWVKRLPADGVDMEMLEPIHRVGNAWFPWVWFHGKVTRTEKPGRHDAKGIPCDSSM